MNYSTGSTISILDSKGRTYTGTVLQIFENLSIFDQSLPKAKGFILAIGEVGETGLNPDGTDLDTDSNVMKNVKLLGEEAAKIKIDAYKEMEATNPNLFTTFNREEFEALKKVYPELVSAVDFNNPETQQWFEINFDGMAGAGQQYG